MISITLENEKLSRALTELAKASKFGLGSIIKEEGKYLTQLFIKFTPPKSKKDGQNAVRGDFSRLAQPLVFQDLEAKATEGGFYKSMARYVRNRQIEKLRALLRNPNLKYYYGMTLLENQDALKKYHRSQRNARGRITGRPRVAAFGLDFRRLRKETEDSVGWTIAGWIPSAKATGAKYKKFAEKLANKSGSVRFWFGRADQTAPFILALNRNVKIPNYQAKIDAAFNSRIATTLKKIKRLQAGKAVNLGFTRVQGAAPVMAPSNP